MSAPSNSDATHVHFGFMWAIIEDCPCGCTNNDPDSVVIEDELSDVMDTLRHERKVSIRTILNALQVIQRRRGVIIHKRQESEGLKLSYTVVMLMSELVEA